MGAVTYDTDVIIHVYQSTANRVVGQRSPFSEEPHPGTNQKIEGWKWDERTWSSSEEEEALALAPSLWDPTVTSIEETEFQSGYGDNNDLLLLGIEEVQMSGEEAWAPKINHGYFYVHDEEWYLYSDSYLTQYFTASGVEGGKQYLQLSHDYKPTIPIQVRTYRYDFNTGRHLVDTEFRKVVDWLDDTVPQFKVDLDYSPPRVWLDNDYSEEIGIEIIPVSGEVDLDDMAQLERLGTSDGTADQLYRTEYNPIDPDLPVEIWTWGYDDNAVSWTVIDMLTDFTSSGVEEVKFDYDRGTVLFGDSTTGGAIPPQGHKIGIRYGKGIELTYEPQHSRDDILAYQDGSNVNPVKSATSKGFVFASTELLEPASIVLESTLTRENPYLIELGNNIGELLATVTSTSGTLLEGQEVFFEILNPQVGTFGASSRDVSAVTNAAGLARTLYNSPPTVLDLGRPTNDVTVGTGTTQLVVEGLADPGDTENLVLFQVHDTDEVLGILDTAEDQYYIDYLDEEDIDTGDTATVDFEQEFRTRHNLPKPQTYASDDLITGKKTVVMIQKGAGVMNPHSGYHHPEIWSPIYPTTIEDISTGDVATLRLTYDAELDLPGTNGIKSYFAVGDAITRIRAYVVNPRTNKKIYSNIIEMKVTVPDAVNGTFFADVLNDIPDGLLTRARNVDELTDAKINTTSGIEELYDDYLAEREFGNGYYVDGDPYEPLIDQTGTAESTSTSSTFNFGSTGLTNYDKELWIGAGTGVYNGLTTVTSPPINGFSLRESAYEDTYAPWHLYGWVVDQIVTATGIPSTTMITSNSTYAQAACMAAFRANPTTGAVFVQSGEDSEPTGTSVSVTLPSPPTAGNTLIAVAATWKGALSSSDANSVVTVGDGEEFKRVVYENVVDLAPSQRAQHSSIWVLENVGASAGSVVTANFSSTGVLVLIVLEYSGIEHQPYYAGPFAYETYADWFRRTRRGDTIGLTTLAGDPPDGVSDPDLIGLETVTPVDVPSEIPLGFRLKGSNITLASVLDQVTFLDPNDHLPEGYFDTDSTEDTSSVGMQFEVTIV